MSTPEMSFVLTGVVADVDLTTTVDTAHPSLVLVVDLGAEMRRVIVPASLIRNDLERFAVGRQIRIVGRLVEIQTAGEVDLIAVDVQTDDVLPKTDAAL